MWTVITTFLLLFSSVLLMFIILLQRGRGGGLAGAFGGLGGQSAFGTKAGDVFTKITIGLAIFWAVMAGVTGWAMQSDSQGRYRGGGDATPSEPTLTAPENPKTSSDSTTDPGKTPGTAVDGKAGSSSGTDSSSGTSTSPPGGAAKTPPDGGAAGKKSSDATKKKKPSDGGGKK